MLKRILGLVVAFPVAVFLVTLAVTNRHSVRMALDPFRPEAPAISIVLPFYAYLFGALLLGVLLGGAATWLTQSRWRRSARVRGADAKRWQAEADRLAREREATTSATAGRSRDLVPATRRNAA